MNEHSFIIDHKNLIKLKASQTSEDPGETSQALFDPGKELKT
jgi:hypothetical protein